MEIVQTVVVRTKNINVRNIYGNTLHLSIKYKQLYAMQRLLLYGADIDCLNSLGQSPLHLAVQYADEVMLSLLIKGGAFLEIKDIESSTPLLLAVPLNKEESV
ncbi:hypothetical protein GOM44_03955 [Wolbachia endosymbiont of Atemnus politus]|nr:hypothetical protein [Wolbachia endosymbiont of Atemnus politus]